MAVLPLLGTSWTALRPSNRDGRLRRCTLWDMSESTREHDPDEDVPAAPADPNDDRDVDLDGPLNPA